MKAPKLKGYNNGGDTRDVNLAGYDAKGFPIDKYGRRLSDVEQTGFNRPTTLPTRTSTALSGNSYLMGLQTPTGGSNTVTSGRTFVSSDASGNSTYRDNSTGQTYTLDKTGKPIGTTQTFNMGGTVKKAPSFKKKGYANGGSLPFDPSQLPNIVSNLGASGQAYVDDKTLDDQGRATGVGGGVLSGALGGVAKTAKFGPLSPLLLGYYAAKGGVDYMKDVQSRATQATEESTADAMQKRNAGETNVTGQSTISPDQLAKDQKAQSSWWGKGLNKLAGTGLFSEGGEVHGKGGPKDDKIKANVKPGSFVVPAENAEMAKEMKKHMLKKAPNMKANLNQKGGTKIRLSDGEFVFTPEEKEELLSIGIDLEKLAPFAHEKEHADELAKGGLTPEKAHMMLKEGKANGKLLTPSQRRYFSMVYGNSKK